MEKFIDRNNDIKTRMTTLIKTTLNKSDGQMTNKEIMHSPELYLEILESNYVGKELKYRIFDTEIPTSKDLNKADSLII